MEFTPIKDLLRYLRYPTRRTFTSQVSTPILYVTLLFLLAFTINIFAIAFVNFAIVNLENIGNVFDELDYGFFPMFGLAVIAAPLAEELIFRFPLKFKIPLSILIAGIAAGLVAFFINKQNISQLALFIPVFLFAGILVFFNKDRSTTEDEEELIDRSTTEDEEELIDRMYPVLFYLVAMIFAYIHIFNYDNSQFSVWMTPFIVIPQFILALFLGFVRMRVGLWASIYMHALNNCIPLLLFYSLKDVVVPG